MTQTVFLHYTQDDLNRNFDKRAWVDNALEAIGRYFVHSRATRKRFAHQANIAYGTHPDEVLDFFPAGDSGGPLEVFIYGEAGKNFAKDDYSFAADSYVPAGLSTVVLDFSKMPAERLSTVMDPVRRGITWVHDNAHRLGVDPGRLYVSAQSLGAHLAAVEAPLTS